MKRSLTLTFTYDGKAFDNTELINPYNDISSAVLAKFLRFMARELDDENVETEKRTTH